MLTRRALPLLAIVGLAFAAPAAAQAAGNTATFTKTSDWGSGFVGNYVIRNNATSSIVGWKLEFDLPPGERLTGAWSAKMSAVGSHYVLTDEDWTRTITPGGSVQVGFQGEYLGAFGAPTGCQLNGQACAGGGTPPPPPPPPDTSAPSAPSNLAAGATTQTSVALSWSAATDNVGVTGYQVFNGATKVATVTGTSTTVTGLAASTSYTFTVKAVDAAGNVSAASGAVSAKTADPPPPPPPPPPSGSVTATFAKSSDWGNGFVGEYTIRNGGTTTVNGWKLEFDLPASETVTSAWSGKLSASGTHYVLTDEDWTRTIAPGASVKVGFQGTYSGAFAAPAACRINNASCDTGGPPPPPDTAAPTAPTNLSAGAPTASTIDLSWSASTDNVGVTGYQVFSGTTKLKTVTGTSTTVGGLNASTSYTFTVKAVDAAGNVSNAGNSATATTTAASSGGSGSGSGATAPGFAPYVDMTLTSDSLATMKAASGVKHYSLGFIVSGAACQASWGGYYGIGDATMNQRISDLKAAGGDAIVSFGGAANQELARTCTSVSALAAQYQAVVDQYGIRDLDFDIEGADQADPPSLDRRFKAIAQVQAAGLPNKPVHVSLTLPTMPTGLTHDGLNVVRTAIADGVDVGTVNVMAMDYFDSTLEPYTGKLGDYAIQAATSVHDQLAPLYPAKSDAAVWRMVGVTPMLGINDNPKEIFTTADATKLTTFAKQKSIGRLAMWSINRDAPCGRPTTYAENLCSGVNDPKWAFSNAFGSFGT